MRGKDAPYLAIAIWSSKNPLGLGSNPSGETNNIYHMEIKFKRLSDKAIMPIRAHEGDAGVDLTCTNIDTVRNEAGQILLVYHTDLAVEIPEGHVGLLFPRSSIWNKSIAMTNSVGVIDSGYRGEIKVVMRSTTDVVPAIYTPGERFVQLVIVAIPQYTIAEAIELSESERGEDGFGSTGTAGLEGKAIAESNPTPPEQDTPVE